MHDYQLLHNSLALSGLLFALGAIGFACRRDLAIVLLSAGMMLLAAVMALAAYGRFHGDTTGQMFGLFGLAVTTVLALIALAIGRSALKQERSLDLARWQRLGQSGSLEANEQQTSPETDELADESDSAVRQQASTYASAADARSNKQSAEDTNG